jgi:hypothetical protein
MCPNARKFQKKRRLRAERKARNRPTQVLGQQPTLERAPHLPQKESSPRAAR